MRVAVLRCERLPGFVTWDIADAPMIFSDDEILIAGFAARGIEAEAVTWSDPTVDWDRYHIALLRSTWDYIDRREEFLSVLEAIERSPCRLFNPLEVVRWNSEKSYLFDLESRGVPIVPTRLAPPDPDAGQRLVAALGWDRVVVKPAVGVGATDVQLVAADEVARTIEQLRNRTPERRLLLQPFVKAIRDEGELSFVFFDRALAHVLRKTPAQGDYRAHGIWGGTVQAVEVSASDIREATAILANVPFDPLYARIDMVRHEERLVVMELELIEPMLYLEMAPKSTDRLVRATIERIERAPSRLVED